MGNKKNQKVRKELEEEYGKGCMFKKAGIDKKLERIKGIKTYRQFVEEKRYEKSNIDIDSYRSCGCHFERMFQAGGSIYRAECCHL
jgi:hypothetical protein